MSYARHLLTESSNGSEAVPFTWMRNWDPKRTCALLVIVKPVHGLWAQLCFYLCLLFCLMTCWAQILLSSIPAGCSMEFIMGNSWCGQQVPASALSRWGKNLGRFNCLFLKVPQVVLIFKSTFLFLKLKVKPLVHILPVVVTGSDFPCRLWDLKGISSNYLI